MANQTLKTPAGTGYESVKTTASALSKDGVRLFIPENLNREVTVVWLIHGFGSSHDALLGGYAATGTALVDAGCVVVCPNLGGSLWSSPRAQSLLKTTASTVGVMLSKRGATVTRNVMVGTSHGGCIATYATAKKLLPNIAGLYLVNGVYNPQSTRGSYGSLMPLDYRRKGGTTATNPSRLPISSFTVPVRVVYDETDPTVDAPSNGKLLATRLTQAGKMVTTRVHNSEHHTPGGTPKDVVGFLRTLEPVT